MTAPHKRLAILGSTGSIGQSTLALGESFPGRYRPLAFAAGSNPRRRLRSMSPLASQAHLPRHRRARAASSTRIDALLLAAPILWYILRLKTYFNLGRF